MSRFDLAAYITDVRNAYRARNGALLFIAEKTGRDLAETTAQLDAAEWTLHHLRGSDQPNLPAIDAPAADIAEAVEIAHLITDDYDAIRAAFVTVATQIAKEHKHPPGAGADRWCSVCRIEALIPVRIYEAARANQQGAQQ